MPRYAITEKAGPFVAAHRNCGVGTVLELSIRQAEHELRLGTLVPLDAAQLGEAAENAPHQPTAGDPGDVSVSIPKPRRPAKA